MVPYVRAFRVHDGNRQRLLETINELGHKHAEDASTHDREGTVNRPLLDDLRNMGYLGAAVPRAFGGGGFRLVDLVLSQSVLAEHDPSTALGVGMHHMVIGDEAQAMAWPAWRRKQLLRQVGAGELMLNVLATEPLMGSPQGHTPPATSIERGSSGRWELSGAKSFSTFAPVLTHAVVYCSVGGGTGQVARVLVPMGTEGVTIEQTWDTIGMRATESHDVHFDRVQIPDGDVLAIHQFTNRTTRPAMTPWFTLLVSAVYLGIARGALREACQHAVQRASRTAAAPSTGPMSNLSQCYGRLLVAEAGLLSAAATADAGLRPGTGLTSLEVAAKLEVARAAIEAVDLAVRSVGGSSLRRGSRLERAWRDVRSATVHPPSDTVALDLLSGSAASLVREDGRAASFDR
ncbi:MAG: acyl-CoA dehydrogenase family protein [Dehalococcoidia bacterium]